MLNYKSGVSLQEQIEVPADALAEMTHMVADRFDEWWRSMGSAELDRHKMLSFYGVIEDEAKATLAKVNRILVDPLSAEAADQMVRMAAAYAIVKSGQASRSDIADAFDVDPAILADAAR